MNEQTGYILKAYIRWQERAKFSNLISRLLTSIPLVSTLDMCYTPLPPCIGLDIRQARMSSTDTASHFLDLRIAHRRSEGFGLPRLGALGVQLVHLLQAEPFGLIDQGPNEEGADKTKGTPDEEHFGLEVCIARTAIDHVGGRVGDRPVEEPVGRCRYREALGSYLQREEFACHNPCNRSPVER